MGTFYLEEVKKSEFFREEKPLDLARQSVVEAINQNSKMHSGVILRLCRLLYIKI